MKKDSSGMNEVTNKNSKWKMQHRTCQDLKTHKKFVCFNLSQYLVNSRFLCNNHGGFVLSEIYHDIFFVWLGFGKI